MPSLSSPSQLILVELLKHMASRRVVPNDPTTFAGYKEIHDALGLTLRAKTFGDSLKIQGLAELAEWTLREKHPAITGLVVNKSPSSDSYLRPGQGYFELFDKSPEDFIWWTDQVKKSLTHPWHQLLVKIAAAPPTKESNDLPTPPERVPAVIYRILRDTDLARSVKMAHNYQCQICGHAIKLPDGTYYAEAHHIQPLGAPHDGPDIIGNILCLCPNHHAELDYCVSQIDVTTLRLTDNHLIDSKYVEYHNRLFESTKSSYPLHN